MQVVLTTLSNELFQDSKIKLCLSADRVGIQKIYSYDFKDIIDTEFYRNNQHILKCSKGLGYWLWKSHIILESLTKVDEGDIVIYLDPGIEILESLDPIINLFPVESFAMLFGNANDINAHWTKRDCFVYMDCDNESYWYASHCDASFLILKKCDLSIKFIKEWQYYGGVAEIMTEAPNKSGKKNLPGFIEHRFDQSILSLLAVKYKVDLFRMPTQFGNHYKMHKYRIDGEFNCINQKDQRQLNFYAAIPYLNSHYGQLLNHHRKINTSNQAKLELQTIKKSVEYSFTRTGKKLINTILKKFGYKIIKI